MQKNLNVTYVMLFFLPLLGLFCFDNILFIWGIMEMQMMCYVCTLLLKTSKFNYMMSFIVIQLMAGILLFYFCFLSNFKEIQQNMVMLMMLLILFMKMGMYPFASWALKFINGLQGFDYWLFLTVMKIVPLAMCFFVDNSFFILLIAMNWAYSSLILSYHSGYKKIIFFSSISNTCIFFVFFFMGFLSMAKIFLLFYFSFISILILFLEKNDCDFIFSGKKIGNSILMFLMIISLVGMPFLWGFITKSLFMMSFFFSKSLLFLFMLFVVSLIFSFFYLKLIFFFFLKNDMWSSNLSFLIFNEKGYLYFFFLLVAPLFSLTLFFFGTSFFI